MKGLEKLYAAVHVRVRVRAQTCDDSVVGPKSETTSLTKFRDDGAADLTIMRNEYA
jgi:hypothetical protein